MYQGLLEIQGRDQEFAELPRRGVQHAFNYKECCRAKKELLVQVMAQINKGSKAKKVLATFFLSVSGAFIRSRRIIDGLALQYATKPRPVIALVRALLTAAILFPLHKYALLIMSNLCKFLHA